MQPSKSFKLLELSYSIFLLMLCQNNVLVRGCILCSFIHFLRIIKFCAVVIFNRNFLYTM